MDLKRLASDLEIRKPKSKKDVFELFRAYNIRMEGDSDKDEEIEVSPDITVPIIEMACDDTSNEQINYWEDECDQNYDGETYDGRKEKTKSNNNLKLKVTEEQVRHRCDICGATFRIKHSITKHKRVIHGLHQFKCMFCDKSYPLKRVLLKHIQTHKGPNGFKCNICEKLRPNYISIQRHVRTHGQKNIPCTKCGALFKTKWELRSHETQHKDQVKQSDETVINKIKLSEQFKCDICSKEFNLLGNLTMHKKLHFEDKPYKCHYCSISFYTNSARKKHEPEHEREKRKPFKCPECSKKYTSMTSLAVHKLKFHTGGKVFHCNYCKERFENKEDMVEHVEECHAQERPHSCQHCMCRYKNKRELRRHQREKEHYDAGKKLSKISLQSYQTDEFDDDDDDDDWIIPEPEVCINVVENESILPE